MCSLNVTLYCTLNRPAAEILWCQDLKYDCGIGGGPLKYFCNIFRMECLPMMMYKTDLKVVA
jgi:hypothetical protein